MFLSVAVVKLKNKKKSTNNSNKVRISKKTNAEIIENNNILMARVIVPSKHGDNVFDVKLTPESFIPKGKNILFTKDNNKYVMHHISPVGRMIPRSANTYHTLRPHLIVSGYLVKIDNVLYFDYANEIISFSNK